MTREETVQVLSLLKAAFPNSYKGMTRQEANGVISVWSTQFANIPVQIVLIAINKLISISTFPPSIAEVKNKLKNLYYEATSELLIGTDYLKDDEKQKLMAIQKYCYSDNTEPSLVSMLSNNQLPMIENRGDDDE